MRYAFSSGQKLTFGFLAAVVLTLVVAGIVQGNLVALIFGVLMTQLAWFIGRQALGPEQAYVIDPTEFRHMRGEQVLLAVPWEQVTHLRVLAAKPRIGLMEQLAFDLPDASQVVGAHSYRNTRKVTGHDIVINLGPLGGRSVEVGQAAIAAWTAATGRT
jgi:hypothetical protein